MVCIHHLNRHHAGRYHTTKTLASGQKTIEKITHADPGLDRDTPSTSVRFTRGDRCPRLLCDPWMSVSGVGTSQRPSTAVPTLESSRSRMASRGTLFESVRSAGRQSRRPARIVTRHPEPITTPAAGSRRVHAVITTTGSATAKRRKNSTSAGVGISSATPISTP